MCNKQRTTIISVVIGGRQRYRIEDLISLRSEGRLDIYRYELVPEVTEIESTGTVITCSRFEYAGS
jgi:hypothetical protein